MSNDNLPLEERRTSIIGDLIRGALIGVVETVPGVSGGTIALVVGIYARLIRSASHVVSALRRLMTGPNRLAATREQFALVEWKLIVPVLIGMVLAVFTIARPMANLVTNHPELTRAAFFGMVLASIAIPLRMAGLTQAKWYDYVAGVVAAGFTFWLVSIPPTTVEPSPLVIILAAAIAVSALLLPGLSGSFLLLTLGLYEPTLRAVADRDVAYLGLFALGLFIGVISAVKGLEWLLRHHRRITLLVLSGVMVGALRTLWPWQSDQRDLLSPEENWPLAFGLALIGLIIVSTLAIVDARLSRKAALALANPKGRSL